MVDSQDENENGLGSVRRIYALPGVAFEESVVRFEPNQLMEYTVSKGSPIKKHRGRMEFAEDQGKTRLTYSTEVSPFFRKISNCTEVKIFKKILVGVQNAIQFLCQYLLLFQLVT